VEIDIFILNYKMNDYQTRNNGGLPSLSKTQSFHLLNRMTPKIDTDSGHG
jgi:hypothetical protein